MYIHTYIKQIGHVGTNRNIYHVHTYIYKTNKKKEKEHLPAGAFCSWMKTEGKLKKQNLDETHIFRTPRVWFILLVLSGLYPLVTILTLEKMV